MHLFSLPCEPMQKLLIWLIFPIVTGVSRQGTSKAFDSHVQCVVFMTCAAASSWHSRQARVTSCPVLNSPFTISLWSTCTGFLGRYSMGFVESLSARGRK